MNPTQRLRRVAFPIVAVLLIGSVAGLSVSAVAQESLPGPGKEGQGGKGAPVPPGSPQGGTTRPAEEPSGEGLGVLPIMIIVLLVAGVIGGVVFLFLRTQGSGKDKDKVAETANSIGPYRLEKPLQQGATSQVYEVAEMVSGRHFAMKMLLPEHAKDPVQRRLLFNEAEVGIELAHPNVIKIIKVFKNVSTPCFVMEFFPSGSMRQRIQYRDWDFIKEHAHEVLKQTATALAYMNSNGWLHRDVKPDNILVNSAGEVRLIDFAIAQRIPTGLAKWFRRKERIGTRSFMSPEAIRREALDTRSDIYSFGATCYEIVTFRTPFKGSTANEVLNKHLYEKPTSPQAYCADLTDDFSKLLLRLLGKRREERLRNFHEVLMELRKVKIFKTANPALPRDGGPLSLHPEAATSIRRPTGKPTGPKGPEGGAKPKG